jgi:hypothetical protein
MPTSFRRRRSRAATCQTQKGAPLRRKNLSYLESVGVEIYRLFGHSNPNTSLHILMSVDDSLEIDTLWSCLMTWQPNYCACIDCLPDW